MSIVAGQYDFRGITFGDGTDYLLESVEGLDVPPMRGADVARSGADGDDAGTDVLASREIIVTLEVFIPGDPEALHDALTDLRLAWAPAADLQPFTFWHPPLPRLVAFCRPRRATYRLERRSTAGSASVAVALYAPDPLLYADVEQSQETPPYGAGSGHAFPHDFPLRFVGSGGSAAAQLATCVNGGNRPTLPVVAIAGPVDRPIIENVTTGATLALDMNLGPADVVTIDMREHTILLGGSSSYRGAMTSASSWLSLQPGTNEIRFRSVGVADAAARATITWRDAWL